MSEPESTATLNLAAERPEAKWRRLRQAEHECTEWRTKYEQLMQFAPTGVYEIDFQNWRFVFVNEVICYHTGYTQDELMALDPREFLTEKSRLAFIDRYKRLLSGEHVDETAEYQIVAKDGRRIWVKLNIRFKFRDGLPSGAVVVAHDISAIRRAEAARREAEHKYGILFANALDAIIIIQDGQIRYHNPKTAELTEYDNRELRRMYFTDLIHPEDRDEALDRHLRRLDGQQLSNPYTFRVVKKSGAIGWGQANAVRLPWAGRPAVLCTVRDITQQKEAEVALLKAYDALEEMVAQRTAALMQANEALKTEIQERKQSEAALRESDQKYKTLVDNLPDIVFATDRLGRITHINLPAETTYGYRASGLIGQQFSTLIYSKERARVAGYFRNAIEKRIGIIRGLQFRMVAKDGTTHWVEANLRRHFDESGQFLRTDGVIRDISENKLLLNQLIRSERLAAIGQLAASVAHEINSPLQGMISLVEAMQKNRPDEAALHENLKMLRNAFDDIHVTVTNLQELHRLEKDRQKPVSINPIIENTVRLIRSYLKKNRITVSMQLEDQLPDICVSPRQISQVLMNLINNAVEAMNPASGKGRQKPHARGGLILIRTFQQCDQVVIEVKDTGPGIMEADVERIFDPSYTQKKQRGVGVGLSVCHCIIEDHHGTLVAGNLPDGGAVITIKLPINR